MSLEIYVQGQILNVKENGDYINVYGILHYLFLYNKCCDTDVIIRLYNLKGYLNLYGHDLEIVKQNEDEVKIEGNLSRIKVFDRSGTLLHDFDVQSCTIVVTEMRNEEKINVSKPDEDIEIVEEE